jgi:hypothetical protein
MFRCVRAVPYFEIERESDPATVSLFTVNSLDHCFSGERCSFRVRVISITGRDHNLTMAYVSRSPFDNLQTSEFACHPGRSHRWPPMWVSGRPWRLHPSRTRFVTSPRSDMLAVRNRAIDGIGLSPPRPAALLAAPVNLRPSVALNKLHVMVSSYCRSGPSACLVAGEGLGEDVGTGINRADS